MSILVDCQMYGSETATPDFLLDHILIDFVHGRAVLVAASVVCACIERFLDGFAAGGCAAVMSYRALVGGRGHVLDHLRTAMIGGGREVDVYAVRGEDAMRSLDLGRRSRALLRGW